MLMFTYIVLTTFLYRNGLGTFYGTIGGGVTAFSPLSTRSKQATIPGKNMYTNPGKKGTGYG